MVRLGGFKFINESIKSVLRGVSQVMLQNNALTGLLFLAGIFYSSWQMGVGALIGALSSTLISFILNFNKKDILDGIYGFNGVLVGISLLFFFEFGALTICLIILGSFLSSTIMNFMYKRRLSPYTFPFILSTWIMILLIRYFDLIPQRTFEVIETANIDLLSSLAMGFGQVMFQASIVTGAIFLLAILVNSRVSAIYAFIGSFLGMAISLLFSFPLNLANMGIFGFNGVLCGIAFADKKKSSLLFAIISIIISVVITYGMLAFNLIALTAPFVFATWITLGLRRIRLKNKYLSKP
jgi:urea transporter